MLMSSFDKHIVVMQHFDIKGSWKRHKEIAQCYTFSINLKLCQMESFTENNRWLALFGLCLDNRVTKGEEGKEEGRRAPGSKLLKLWLGFLAAPTSAGSQGSTWLTQSSTEWDFLSPHPKPREGNSLFSLGFLFFLILTKSKSLASAASSESQNLRGPKRSADGFPVLPKNTYAHPQLPRAPEGIRVPHSLHWPLVKLTCNLTKSRRGLQNILWGLGFPCSCTWSPSTPRKMLLIYPKHT